ncbi:glutathione hydrolase 5 proenzyme-like [Poeciliopsis prolifica]|uniref:glutathione hydrolase 5 proenzyme-like n=1 Tax=Poeciliopsis prolifica TaxID=188132 RepID=UPI002413A538|nr:glutathione hydrolase 5 proenzyme-like [Poeciliopsis prolifica]
MASWNMKMMVCAFATLLVLVCILLGVIICLAKSPNGLHPPECPEESFTKGAVAADNEKCSEIGLKILRQGGSAVDAAIAALLCTGIMNPHTAGIGGGSIFTIMDKSGDVKIINSREAAPFSVVRDLLKSCPKDSSKATGTKWIGVPGEIRGYEVAHKLYKKLNWSDLFKETIKLAREGVHISLILGSYLPQINETESLRKLYSDENGNLLKHRDVIKYEKLADTLELIANEGPDAFYSGTIAKDLIKISVFFPGGNLEEKDFELYNATETDAWVVPVGKNYQMYIPPPPSGGSLLRLVLDFMKEYENKPAPRSVEEKTKFYGRYVEALKWANDLRKCIRDPRFFFRKKAKEMTDINFADNPNDICAHNSSQYKFSCSYESVGTTHMSVVDQYGTFVAVTSSINAIFGSRVYSPNTGILLNNQLADFCGVVTNITPEERPPSSMAPAVLKPISSTSKFKTLVIGASGGRMITTGIASAVINHLWFGKSLKEAIDAPVLFVHSNSTVKFEPGIHRGIIKELEALGHNQMSDDFYNVVNAVEKNNGYICAVSDDRKLGKAAGY